MYVSGTYVREAVYRKFKLNERIQFCTRAKALQNSMFSGKSTTPLAHYLTQCRWIYWVRETDCVLSKKKVLLLDCSSTCAKGTRSEDQKLCSMECTSFPSLASLLACHAWFHHKICQCCSLFAALPSLHTSTTRWMNELLPTKLDDMYAYIACLYLHTFLTSLKKLFNPEWWMDCACRRMLDLDVLHHPSVTWYSCIR